LKRQSLIYKKSHPREKKNTAKAKNIKKKKKENWKTNDFCKSNCFFFACFKSKSVQQKLTT